jgi:hypothetical protein
MGMDETAGLCAVLNLGERQRYPKKECEGDELRGHRPSCRRNDRPGRGVARSDGQRRGLTTFVRNRWVLLQLAINKDITTARDLTLSKIQMKAMEVDESAASRPIHPAIYRLTRPIRPLVTRPMPGSAAASSSSLAIYRLTRPIRPLVTRPMPGSAAASSSSASAAAAETNAFAAKMMQSRSNWTDEQLARLLKSANATKLDVKMGEPGQQKTDPQLLGLLAAEEDRAMPWRELFIEAADIAARIHRPFFGLQSAFIAVNDTNAEKAELQAYAFVRCFRELWTQYGWREGSISVALEKDDPIAPSLYLALALLQKLNEYSRIAKADQQLVRFAAELEACFLREVLLREPADKSSLSDEESEDALQLMITLVEHPKLSIVRSAPNLTWIDWNSAYFERSFSFFHGFSEYLIDSEPIGVERIKDCIFEAEPKYFPAPPVPLQRPNDPNKALQEGPRRPHRSNRDIKEREWESPWARLRFRIGIKNFRTLKEHLQDFVERTQYGSVRKDILSMRRIRAAANHALMCLTRRLTAARNAPITIGDDTKSLGSSASAAAASASASAASQQNKPSPSAYAAKKGGCTNLWHPRYLNHLF